MIDLRSDTVTKPSAGMREAMANAVVGDDVFGDDPSVNQLQNMAAKLLGKEAALMTPSGTMANLIAFLAQARHGDTVVLSKQAHPFQYEAANFAAFGGLMARTIDDRCGKFTATQLRQELVLIDDPHFSRTTLVSIENTTNRGGGAIYTAEEIAAIATVAQEFSLRLHCDGARIFNAAVTAQCDVRDLSAHCDTVCFCLSKGLGCPAGSILAGTHETIHRAIRLRKMLGGGMRQVGVLAAAGIYALENHRSDLAADHRRAAEFRTALESQGFEFTLPSPSNILYLRVADAFATAGSLAEHGIQVLPHALDEIRVVFHRDIDDAALEQVLSAFINIRKAG